MNILKSSIACSLLALLSLPLSAQQLQEERRSKIPFAFTEFKEAKVNQPFGRYTKAKINFRLWDGALCFIDTEENVRRAYVKNILSVDVDSVRYMKVDSVFGQVIASQNYNFLVRVTLIDKKAWGQEVTELNEMMANGGGTFKWSILDLEEKAAQGYILKDEYYFILRGNIVRARESYIKKQISPEYKEAFKTLMADRWWSWHDPQCLAKLLMYFPK